MKPVVILDTNAIYGRKPFTRPDSIVLLALAKTDHIRLVLPEVVLLELARHWAETLSENMGKITAALKVFNETLADVGVPGGAVDLPTVNRLGLYNAALASIESRSVEIAPRPDVSVSDLLDRDLDARKPFAKDGKGFRDALIWETVRALCTDLQDRTAPVIFVTNNHRDFCVDAGGALHADLEAELPLDLRFEVVRHLKDLMEHSDIQPLAKTLHVVEEVFTRRRLEKLVDKALSELHGHNLDQALGVYEGEGLYINPITGLVDSAFNWLDPVAGTIKHEVFRTGDAGEMTIRVTVEVDCEIEGFIDKSEFFMQETDGYTYVEDWNTHMFRVIEPHHLLFTLTAEFTDATIEDIDLTAAEAEDVFPTGDDRRAMGHQQTDCSGVRAVPDGQTGGQGPSVDETAYMAGEIDL